MSNQHPQFEFTPEDLASIEAAKADAKKTWYSNAIKELKKRIKDYYLRNVINECCYCRRPFEGEFKLSIDIEHILPQSVFEEFMFEPMNLSLACKRCNMLIKSNDITFLTVDVPLVRQSPFKRHYYLLIHPNVDCYHQHLGKVSGLVDGIGIVKYYPKKSSPKGVYTYDYFRLNELEINNMDVAQGDQPGADLSEDIPVEIRNQLEELNKRLNK